ncbi:OB-fold nucleic acid binding domain-containing protein, partial [Crocinitomicaceae bacterium]|nr:OB-fold nucleic acid binding domain-containing protein [Crocinitomicaceae bacterium]
MYRSHTCGELSSENIGSTVTIAGWVQTIRDKGNLIWVDIRDRYGITQVVGQDTSSEESLKALKSLGREFVVQITGTVSARSAANPNIETGEIELLVEKVVVLNASLTPPFTIEDNTDGGEELRA